MIDSSSTYVALIEGLLSFFSPCIFPLFPIYLTTLGLDGNIITKTNKKIIISTLIFISSFTFIFLLLALTSTTIGLFFNINKLIMIKISGILIIIFGLMNIGFFKNRFFNKTYLLNLNSDNKFFKPFLLGISFGFAWTPCIGPVLGSVLAYSAAGKNIESSLITLSFYSIGLGIPFFIGSLGYKSLIKKFNDKSKIYYFFSNFMGFLLIIFGLIVFNNKIYILNLYFQKFINYLNNFFI